MSRLPIRTFLLVLFLCQISVLVLAQTEDDVDNWYGRAEKFASRGQWRRAANYYAKIVAVEKDDPETFEAYFLSLLGCGRYEELGKLTATMVKKQPRDRTWFLHRMTYLRAVGQDDEALRSIEEFLSRRDNFDFEIKSLLGQIHLDHGRDKQAKEIFDGLIERARKTIIREASDLTGLGRAYRFYSHGGQAAEEALASAQKADKKYLEAYYQLALVYGTLKVRPTDMNRELKDALKLRPRWLRFLAGQILSCDLRLGQAEGEKRKLVKTILSINPRHPDALYHLGMRQLSDAKWMQSKKTFEKAIDTNPNHLLALSGLGALKFVTHDSEGWKKLERKVLSLDPTFGGLYRIVATGLSERRRWDESQAMMKKAVTVDAKDPNLWDDLARYSLYVGDEKEGIAALKVAYDLATYNRVWRANMMDVMKLLEEKYVTEKSKHFVIKLHKDDAALLKNIVPSFFERSWDEFVERYGFEPRVPVIVDAFRRHTDFSVRTMGTSGLGAVGVCFGPTVMMFIPRKTQRPVNWASTAHHELAHVFTLQASRGRVPRWLTEGLSTWEEVRRNPSWGRNMEIQLHDAYHNGKILPVLDFDTAFYGPRIIFAYYQGGLASQFIEETWGIEALRSMLTLYGEDKLTQEVIPKALHISPHEFDQKFLRFVENMLKPLKRMPRYDADTIRRCEAEIVDGKNVVENRIKVAWGHFRAGSFIDTDAALKPLLDEKVDDPRIKLLLAHRAWRGKRRDVAKNIYEELTASGFEDFDMTVRLALAYEKDGKDGKALQLWKKAEKQNPWSIDPKRSPYIVLAERFKAEGNLDAWAQEVEKYCGLVDVAVKPRLELVEFYLKKERNKDAIRVLAECLDVQTFNPKLRFKLAEIFLQENRLTECMTELNSVLSLKPGPKVEFDSRMTLARILLKLDRLDDASYHLTRALELRPEDAEAKSLLKKAERNEK